MSNTKSVQIVAMLNNLTINMPPV